MVSGTNELSGGNGDDLLFVQGRADAHSNAGNDEIIVGGNRNGATTAYGDEGDDRLVHERGPTVYLYGGEGDDVVSAYQGVVDGGAGNDVVGDYFPSRNGTVDIFGGDGDHTIYATQSGTDVTGGAGPDTIHSRNDATVLDFTPGEDALVLDVVTPYSGYTPENSGPEIRLTDVGTADAPATQVEIGLIDPNDNRNGGFSFLDQTVVLQGVTPDQIGDDDITINVMLPLQSNLALKEAFGFAENLRY